MYCSRCGLEMPVGVTSCGRCGEPADRGQDARAYAVASPYSSDVSPRSRLVMLLLCVLVGVPGVHRFYAGRIWTGFLWLCTFSLLGIGYIYDIIMIVCGAFRDGQGRRIVRWE